MQVFVTGANGWIGSATVEELMSAGHGVVGLVRSDSSAAALEQKGATALRGDLDDLGSLRRGAAAADAVIHLANKHDWANPAESDRAEGTAVRILAEALVGSDRPFVVANAISGLVEGRPALETDASPAVGPGSDRGGAENLALDYVDRGVGTVIVRFAPSVHGAGDWGFVNFLVSAARECGRSGYIGAGENTWSAVHRSDAARLIRLGLDQAPAGTRLHAVHPGLARLDADRSDPGRGHPGRCLREALTDAVGDRQGLTSAVVRRTNHASWNDVETAARSGWSARWSPDAVLGMAGRAPRSRRTRPASASTCPGGIRNLNANGARYGRAFDVPAPERAENQ